jgi:hypothetical protein
MTWVRNRVVHQTQAGGEGEGARRRAKGLGGHLVAHWTVLSAGAGT